MQAVVLASGGLDSSLILKKLKDRGYDLYPLHINYGQRALEREARALAALCETIGVRPPEQFDLRGFASLPSALVRPDLDLETQAFLPMRNLAFLIAAGAYAYSKGIAAVAIGLVANPIFPDQTERFIAAAETAMEAATDRKISVLAPLLKLDKREVIQLAKAEGLAIGLTYYCHAGESEPCGRCLSCKERGAAEASLKIAEGQE